MLRRFTTFFSLPPFLQVSLSISLLFLLHFTSTLGQTSPKIHQKPIKICEKRQVEKRRCSESDFYRFLMDFGFPWGSKIYQNHQTYFPNIDQKKGAKKEGHQPVRGRGRRKARSRNEQECSCSWQDLERFTNNI